MNFEPAGYLDALSHDASLALLPMQRAADVRGVSRAAIDRMVNWGS
jgi:hypothetical protein